ncbi:hypothetical protein BJ508DRAFT_414904 [Ascobolus immersus RN42]|uniref:WD40 repeat-like protein n=1 Tax=Ascobolus immersus RN42 TaxID=1160509 RepID=A0A3N4IHX3_ASCIM|nr:hypothetical protein BJ508DRAFT_414904 [Ascobolus immersus RN42]
MKPKPSPLTVPFAHWQQLDPASLIESSVTTAKFLHNRLVCGLHSGEIIVFERPGPHGALAVRSRLFGHYAPIVALELLTLRSESGLELEEEEFLLALSRDGRLTKWSLKSGRCLQAIEPIVDPRPRGLKILKTAAKEGDNGGRWLTTTYLLLYGCTTDVVVLNAFTLATVVLWTGNIDWPIPAPYQTEAGVARILTILSSGEVQGWEFNDELPIAVNNDFRTRFNGKNSDWGEIVHIIVSRQAHECRYVIVQRRGLSVWSQNDKVMETADWKMVHQKEFESEKLTALGEDSKLITTLDAFGKIEVFIWDSASQEYQTIRLSVPEGTRISTIAAPLSLKDRIVAFSSSFRENRAIVSQHDLETILASNSVSTEWLDKNDAVYFAPSTKSVSESLPKCSSSAIFCNMLVYASGKSLRFYTLPDFLLRFNMPTRVLDIPDCTGNITLLKTVRVRQIATAGQKEYLVLGTACGEIRIVESGTMIVSGRLSLSTVPLNSAFKLPPDLGRRLRDTLLVTALDGTVGIIDVERAKIMVVFPGHDLKDVVKFGIKAGHNSVNIEYSDGVKREWEIGEEECGILVSPNASLAGSKPSSREGPQKAHVHSLGGPREVHVPWKETVVADYWKEDEDRFDVENGKVFSIAEIPSRKGMPTAAINVRHILQHVEHKMGSPNVNLLPDAAEEDQSYLENAKALLLALWPPARQFIKFPVGHDCCDEQHSVDECPTLGQIGANANMSLLSPATLANATAEDGYCGTFDISPTVSAIGLLVVYLLAQIVLEAEGKKSVLPKIEQELFKKTQETDEVVTINGFVPPSLAVASKFWLDPEERIRDAARIILNRYVSGLSLKHKLGLVKYWKEFLPIRVVPQLFHAKQVPRATILLTEIYVNSAPNTLPEDVGPAIGASLARLLTDPTTPYYKYLAATLLSHNFIHFQSCLPDATTTLQQILQLYRENEALIFPLVQALSRQNYPLLATAISTLLLPTLPKHHHTLHQPSPPSPMPIFGVFKALLHSSPPTIDLVLPILHALAANLEYANHHSQPLPFARELITALPGFLDDLDHTYSTFTFSNYNARFAISLGPGDIKVYDFSNSSKTPTHPIYRLEGVEGWVKLLKWDIHGRYLTGYDEEHQEVVVWRVGASFFESLAGGSDVSGQAVAARNKYKVEGIESLEWEGDTKVVVAKGRDGEKRLAI